MAEEYTYDVFLSHSSRDKPLVRTIAERLRSDGLRVWFDDWTIRPGDSIPAQIDAGLEQSRHLVLFMSAQAFGSDWAHLESYTPRFRDPMNRQRSFIPVRLDDAPIKSSLAQFKYIDFRSSHHEAGYRSLLETCRQCAQAPPSGESEQGDPARRHFTKLVAAKRNEWQRLKADFEKEAANYHDLTFKVFEVRKGIPSSNEMFPSPNHVINLWQYMGKLTSKSARKWAASIQPTKFGLTGAELTSFGVVIGAETGRFVKMASRAGSLLPENVSIIITTGILDKVMKSNGAGKPMMSANGNAVAVWLNLMLLATAAVHPERLRDGTLTVDPFAASITTFDYFGLGE